MKENISTRQKRLNQQGQTVLYSLSLPEDLMQDPRGKRGVGLPVICSDN